MIVLGNFSTCFQISAAPKKVYYLIGADGKVFESQTKGKWGGHKTLKIYGSLHCPSALRWLSKGHYAKMRVFFATEADAIAAGYRPCAVCLPEAYKAWQAKK